MKWEGLLVSRNVLPHSISNFFQMISSMLLKIETWDSLGQCSDPVGVSWPSISIIQALFLTNSCFVRHFGILAWRTGFNTTISVNLCPCCGEEAIQRHESEQCKFKTLQHWIAKQDTLSCADNSHLLIFVNHDHICQNVYNSNCSLKTSKQSNQHQSLNKTKINKVCSYCRSIGLHGIVPVLFYTPPVCLRCQ